MSKLFLGFDSGIDLAGPSKTNADVLGTYLLQITNSLTPVIGTVSSSSGIAVNAGMLESLSGVTGSINLGGSNAVTNGTDSWICAFSYKYGAANPGVSGQILLGNTAGTSSIFSLNADLEIGIFTGSTASTTVIDDFTTPDANTVETFTLAYNKTDQKVYVYKGNILQTFAVLTGNTTTIPLQSLMSLATGTSQALSNIHLIKFAGAGLPSNMSALVAAYNSSPATKLSAWAS